MAPQWPKLSLFVVFIQPSSAFDRVHRVLCGTHFGTVENVLKLIVESNTQIWCYRRFRLNITIKGSVKVRYHKKCLTSGCHETIALSVGLIYSNSLICSVLYVFHETKFLFI